MIFGRVMPGGPGRFRLIDGEVDLGKAKAGQLYVEIEVDESLQLDREHLAIPAGAQGEFVVRKNISSSLGLAKMRERKRRHHINAEQRCGRHPPVARQPSRLSPPPIFSERNRESSGDQ